MGELQPDVRIGGGLQDQPGGQLRGGTQVFQYEAQGGIAYVDELYATWKQNGLYDDFLPGLIDTLKVEKGYAAIPYNLDMRVIWANKVLLDQAGAKVPTDWQSYLDAAEALKKNNVYGYGDGSRGRRLHRTARNSLLDDQQRWWTLR